MTRARWFFSQAGWLVGQRHHPSTHKNERPLNGGRPFLAVIHHISLPAGHFGGTAVDDLFMGRLVEEPPEELRDLKGLRVSSHFFIDRHGVLTQYVSLKDRAWHAGVSWFEGRDNCNDFSIGIELEGTGFCPYTAQQYKTLIKLLRTLRRAGCLEAVTGHEMIAPGRKTDPGPSFDWWRIRQALPSTVRFVLKPQRTSQGL